MISNKNRFFVLTGGPGAGKTTLVEALGKRGFATTVEAGRGVIKEEVEAGGDALPWIDPERFAERMFEWELRSYRRAERQAGPVFFDRGLPDTIGYLRLEGLDAPPHMEEEAWRLRYNARAFIAPPWREIYGRDAQRRQSWDVAVRTFETVAQTYEDLGYDLVEVPRGTVAERCEFLIAQTGAVVPGRT